MTLAPAFGELAQRYGDRISFLKMNRGENKSIVKTLTLRGVPTIIFVDRGEEFSPRLVGDTGTTPENIEKAVTLFLKER